MSRRNHRIRSQSEPPTSESLTRRQVVAGGLALASSAGAMLQAACGSRPRAATFIARVPSYREEIGRLVGEGLEALGIGRAQIAGRSVLLKPNLVETSLGEGHINTHPTVVRGAIEAFLRLGAARVLVAEGPGHRRDTFLVLEESGMAEALAEDRIPFRDLNYDPVYQLSNQGGRTGMRQLTFPASLQGVDWIVSMPKLKTHHWVGATLSMKNLFGVMPGMVYGWPKNVLHQRGIASSIVDIYATLRPHLAIVDGIVGMEGDGPIMGTPRQVGALVLGRNFPAVDATCARIMGIRPERLPHLALARDWLGPIGGRAIEQRGEPIASVRTEFELLDSIPALRNLR